MARTDDDTWDIVSSVGATALIVAAARAAETARPEALIRDDFAKVFTSVPEAAAALMELAGAIDAQSDSTDDFGRLVDYHAVRTRFFDGFCERSCAAGIRQIVIVASGLDARAYRRAWPEHTVIYEMDMPAVLDFKESAITAHGAEPTAVRRAVPVDLRADWPTALRAAGFDSATPTAWLVEGLLPYLPGRAQRTLFERIHRLSTRGSRLAADCFDTATMSDAMARQEANQLMYDDDGDFVCVDWLDAHDWRTESVDSRDSARALGRELRSILAGDTPLFSTFLTASS